MSSFLYVYQKKDLNKDKSRSITSKKRVLIKPIRTDYSLTAVQINTESSAQTNQKMHGTTNSQTDRGRDRIRKTER